MSTSEAITKFQAFEKYNFDNDENFQSGIASLLNNKQENEDELLGKAKLFYYTKFIDPFNLEAYKEWKEKDQKPTIIQDKADKKDDSEKPPKLSFQELVDMIEKGIEIPGIKQIPNVLNEGTPSEPKMTARPKPWEIKKEEQEEKNEEEVVTNV